MLWLWLIVDIRCTQRPWDGNRYEHLTPSADALETKYPLAATILRRAMIDYTLKNAKNKRYRNAAHRLLECKSLAPLIDDFGPSNLTMPTS
jgi:hypothetical protein